ncbi:MAG: macro domain-containing protein [Patescibacteria group bacterium]|nr:macro domain-containing protein [Patescibacteria group bacterium]
MGAKLISKKINNTDSEIIVIHTDITILEVDAIVNATDKNFSGGGGVDEAIHAVAGGKLKEECEKIGKCETGKAILTNAYKLPAKYVIHTVGPKYGSGDGKEDELLANCYKNSLRLAFEKNLASIAFPNISTGVYRYPKEEAIEIAFSSVLGWLKKHNFYSFKKIYFVSFTEEDYGMNSFYFKELNIG